MKNKDKNLESSCTLYIDGMHCPSCEVLIEKKLLKQDNIESVDASQSKASVDIIFKKGSSSNNLSLKDINNLQLVKIKYINR